MFTYFKEMNNLGVLKTFSKEKISQQLHNYIILFQILNYNGKVIGFAVKIREEDDSGLLERNWLDTTPGQNEIEFGALLRNAKMETDDSTNGEG
jgi:hypothetical protein